MIIGAEDVVITVREKNFLRRIKKLYKDSYSTVSWISLKACIIILQKNKCAMYKHKLEDSEFTLHHIVTRDKGGKDELDNLIGLCDKCHDIAEFKELNREEIINYFTRYSLSCYNEYIKPIEKGYFMPEIDNQMEYKYPEEIILKEKYIIPLIVKRPDKYTLIYGMSLKEIANTFGVCLATIHNWFKNPEKRKWMESILKNL